MKKLMLIVLFMITYKSYCQYATYQIIKKGEVINNLPSNLKTFNKIAFRYQDYFLIEDVYLIITSKYNSIDNRDEYYCEDKNGKSFTIFYQFVNNLKYIYIEEYENYKITCYLVK